MAILVAAAVFLGVVFVFRQIKEPAQIEVEPATAPARTIQPNASPSEIAASPAVPARPIEERYPNAKSLGLTPPSPPTKGQYFRIVVGQVLGLDLPQEMTSKEGYPEIRMQPAEAQKLLEDLDSLSRSGFTIPRVVEAVGRGLDSGGFARFHIDLEAGGSIFQGYPFDPGDTYSVEIQPETGVAHLIGYPGVLRDDQ